MIARRGRKAVVRRTSRVTSEVEIDKHPLNVTGRYYVLCSECLDHECCIETAPNNFRIADDWSAYVFKQPETSEEEARCRQALEECPVNSIRDDGDKET